MVVGWSQGLLQMTSGATRTQIIAKAIAAFVGLEEAAALRRIGVFSQVPFLKFICDELCVPEVY